MNDNSKLVKNAKVLLDNLGIWIKKYCDSDETEKALDKLRTKNQIKIITILFIFIEHQFEYGSGRLSYEYGNLCYAR